MIRRSLLVLIAVLGVAAAVAYGLEQPAAYDPEVGSYFYPRRPYRDLVLIASVLAAAVLLTVAVRRRPVPETRRAA